MDNKQKKLCIERCPFRDETDFEEKISDCIGLQVDVEPVDVIVENDTHTIVENDTHTEIARLVCGATLDGTVTISAEDYFNSDQMLTYVKQDRQE